MESAECGAAGEALTYGNREGLDLLEEGQDTKDRLKRLEDQMAQFADHQAQITRLQNRIDVLTNEVHVLNKDADRYYKIRHRFIDVYLRDVLGEDTGETRDRIHDGNTTAHEGDAVTDAKLYTNGQRNDEYALTGLYGLTVSQILLFSKCLTPKFT